MISKLCSLVGHRRDKKRARPHLETWRSECVRCGVPMVRSARGLWTDAPSLRDFAPPSDPAKHAHAPSFPVRSPGDAAKSRVSTAEQQVARLPFSHELASAISAERFAATDRSPPTDWREHYLARSAECRRLAEVAVDRSIELIHLDMANRYDVLARQAENEPRHLHAVK
jgi:hypothetical protein